ncbi:hypothetical protein MRX96_044992 [Rhipicephalus microplus]
MSGPVGSDDDGGEVVTRTEARKCRQQALITGSGVAGEKRLVDSYHSRRTSAPAGLPASLPSYAWRRVGPGLHPLSRKPPTPRLTFPISPRTQPPLSSPSTRARQRLRDTSLPVTPPHRSGGATGYAHYYGYANYISYVWEGSGGLASCKASASDLCLQVLTPEPKPLAHKKLLNYWYGKTESEKKNESAEASTSASRTEQCTTADVSHDLSSDDDTSDLETVSERSLPTASPTGTPSEHGRSGPLTTCDGFD